MIFLSETHAKVKRMENIRFTLFDSPDVLIPISHVGLAVYVKNELAHYINNVRYDKSTLSFFMGVYIYPTDSKNYDVADYGTYKLLRR